MLIDDLNCLAADMRSSFSWVDCGGCCVVAAEMAKYISNITSARIVGAYSQYSGPLDRNLDNVRYNIILDSLNNLSKVSWYNTYQIDFAHVLIEFEYGGTTYVFDTTHGAVERDNYWSHSRWLPLDGSWLQEEAESFADEREGWNDRFDRNQIPSIRETIATFFQRKYGIYVN